ncbi:hypothetical protein L2E82_18186 [Cichorium intybus]|uniref:Uncharacterized protein n=1 Tax=Cichorium intybus TaxID=13427 RepID=A0ACB9F8U2_CICIN|nr:hypothetical protein L2E82_18186 [Cichorium intybus]
MCRSVGIDRWPWGVVGGDHVVRSTVRVHREYFGGLWWCSVFLIVHVGLFGACGGACELFGAGGIVRYMWNVTDHLKPQSTVVKSFNHARVPVAKPVSTSRNVGGSYAAVLQGDIGISSAPEFIEEDVESDEEEEHLSCNDKSEKESDTEDTLVSGEKCMSKGRCQGSNVILEKVVEDGEISDSKAPSPIVDAVSAQTPSHPLGYTPPCSLARQEGENGVVVANAEVDKPGDSSRPDVITDQYLSRAKEDGSFGGGNGNDIAGPPVQSQSILKRLDDLVEVGQVMGFNMEGCLKNMEQIIDYHGNQNSFQ